MKFLSTLAARSHHCAMFEGGDTLKTVCEQVILPNLFLRGLTFISITRTVDMNVDFFKIIESDVEEFEDNPEEYIRKDIEKSGQSLL